VIFQYTDAKYRIDLPIDTMVQFEHVNTGLSCGPDGRKFHDSVFRQKKVAATRRHIIKQTDPLRKFGCFALMNSPY